MDKRYLYLSCLLFANLPIIAASLSATLVIILIIAGINLIYKNYWMLALLAGTTLISYLIGKLMPVITINEFGPDMNWDNLSIALIIIPVPLIINSLFIWLGQQQEDPASR